MEAAENKFPGACAGGCEEWTVLAYEGEIVERWSWSPTEGGGDR